MQTTPGVQPFTGGPAITELLVALDGTPRSTDALAVVAAYARRLALPVSLVRCCRPYVSLVEARAWLDEVAAGVDGTVKRVEALLTTDVVGDVLATADGVPGSVVCLASHGRTEVGEAMLGSVSRGLVDTSHHPVLLVGPHAVAPTSFAAIQVGVDGSPLSSRAVDEAARWARQLGATPWLTRVGPPGDAPIRDDVLDSGDLHRAAARLEGVGLYPEWDVLHGEHPAPALLEWGRDHGVALYLVGAHSRTGLRELFLGSVANRLVHEADRPVVVVGPSVR